MLCLYQGDFSSNIQATIGRMQCGMLRCVEACRCSRNRAISALPPHKNNSEVGDHAVTNPATEPLPSSVLQALTRYDTPTICNAMEIIAPERRLTGYTVKPLVSPFPDLPLDRGICAHRDHSHHHGLKPVAGRAAGRSGRLLRVCRHRARPAHQRDPGP